MRQSSSRRPWLVLAAWVALAGSVQPGAAQGGGDLNPNLKTDPQALQRFLDMRVGLSIHWGPSSQTGYEISWSRVPPDANSVRWYPSSATMASTRLSTP